MEPEFHITHDEKELIIEALEADIKEKTPHENAETPLIGQLHEINHCMETHLKRLEDLRIRII